MSPPGTKPSSNALYKQALDSRHNEMRLLIVEPDDNANNPLRLQIHFRFLDSDGVKYKALSYT